MTLEKTPHYVNMSKSTGRIQSAKTVKSKEPGPSTYNTDKSWDKQSGVKSTVNVGFSGFGKHINMGVIPTKDKLKIKSERFLDQIVKQHKKLPGVGSYKNVEKAMDNYQAKLPTSLRSKRH